jgi:hypothetical protein
MWGSFAFLFKSNQPKVLDQGSFDGSNPDPFQKLRQDNLPNFHPIPTSIESEGEAANLHFLERGQSHKFVRLALLYGQLPTDLN